MKTLTLLALFGLIAAPALANEKKEAAKPSGEAWKNVDKELGKGAKKIGGILEKQGIDTKGEEKPAEPAVAPAPAPTAAPQAAPAAPGEESFGDKVNRIWFKILGKGDDGLNTQRTDENKEPEKSK